MTKSSSIVDHRSSTELKKARPIPHNSSSNRIKPLPKDNIDNQIQFYPKPLHYTQCP